METCVGEVPQLALAQKIIPALASIVRRNGTVHRLAKEEAKVLFRADEAHKKRRMVDKMIFCVERAQYFHLSKVKKLKSHQI